MPETPQTPPPERPSNPLEEMMQRLRAELIAAGYTVTDLEPLPPGQFVATFAPRPRPAAPPPA